MPETMSTLDCVLAEIRELNQRVTALSIAFDKKKKPAENEKGAIDMLREIRDTLKENNYELSQANGYLVTLVNNTPKLRDT